VTLANYLPAVNLSHLVYNLNKRRCTTVLQKVESLAHCNAA